jgi:signal transduction histidine kinase
VSYLKAVEILAGPLETHDARLHETIQKATREALRASDIIKRLRDFYRSGAVHVALIDGEALVEEVIAPFADRATRLGVKITRDVQLPRKLPTDKIQLQMVLHNLLANALDALEDAPGNRREHVTVALEGGRLRAIVEDSGRGVLPEIRAKLFGVFVESCG